MLGRGSPFITAATAALSNGSRQKLPLHREHLSQGSDTRARSQKRRFVVRAPPFHLVLLSAWHACSQVRHVRSPVLLIHESCSGCLPHARCSFKRPDSCHISPIFAAAARETLPSQQIDTFERVSIAFSAFKQVTLFSSHTFFPIMHLSLSAIPFHLANCFPLPSTSSSPLTPCLPSLPLPPILPSSPVLLSGPGPMCEMSSLQRWTKLCGEMPRRAAGCQQFHLQVRQGQQRVSSVPRQLHPGVSGGLLRHGGVCLCIKMSVDLSSVCLSNLWVKILTSENVAFRETVLSLSLDPSGWIPHPTFFKISYIFLKYSC